MKEFQGVIPSLSAALNKRGYTNLTSVQEAVLAPELEEADLLVSAQTGSGKTVAFGLAIAPTLLEGKELLGGGAFPMALVIAPTRELALQVTRELEWLYAECGGKVASCVGGMDIRTERKALSRNPHIVVGTPGRLRDHIERGYFDTSQLKVVVLDEADEMLDLGFRDELQYILETAPKSRRTLLFSATVPKAIASLAKSYQKNAKRITTKEESKQHVDIEYQAFNIAPSDRENAIINLLRYHDANNAIIFCATRVEVNRLTSRLTNRGFSVVALSGELSQNERSHALQALRDGRAQVCVATDVASRGIDLPGLALVIHADIPKNRDILLHRSGRTGRAGSKGVSALIVPHNVRGRTERILQNAKVNATWAKPPSIKDILERDRERFLTNAAFSGAVTEDEVPTVTELMERYQPEQLAAALIRLHNAQKPAPEELLDAAPSDRQKPNRDAFKNSVWVSLSAGNDMSAEARWILPMICGSGNITKRDIGAIKITQNETFVELTSKCADGFFKALGEDGKLEKNIVATRLAQRPAVADEHIERPRRPRGNNDRNSHRGQSGSYKGGGGGRDSNRKPKKRSDDRKSRGERSGDGEKSWGDKSRSDKPKGDFKKKRDGKSSDGGKSWGDKPKSGKPGGDFKKKSKSGSRDKLKLGGSKSDPKA